MGRLFSSASCTCFVHVAFARGSSDSTARRPTVRREAAGLVAARRGPWAVVVSATATQGSRSSEMERICVGCRTQWPRTRARFRRCARKKRLVPLHPRGGR